MGYSKDRALRQLLLLFYISVCLTSYIFSQIVLTVSQTMWCRDITECLLTEGDRLEAMKNAEQMCVTVRLYWNSNLNHLQ